MMGASAIFSKDSAKTLRRRYGDHMGQGGWTRLGPGLPFAGAAIGTSHLVQATRAGALCLAQGCFCLSSLRMP